MGDPAQGSLTAPLFNDDFLRRDPHSHLAQLRADAPVALDPTYRVWVLSGYPEVAAASRDAGTFSSASGILLSEIGVRYSSPPTMMHTDPPDHTRYRRLVEPAFTAGAVTALEPQVRARAEAVLARVPLDHPTDVATDLAAPYALGVLADLFGIPAGDRDRFREWSEVAVPDVTHLPEEKVTQLMVQLMAYLLTVATDRRLSPRDDLTSRLAAVEVDGDRLEDHELAMFLVQLLVAGNEPSRGALAGALLAFAEHPDQWQRLRNDPTLLDTAVEEVLRWTSPVVYHMRTTTQPVKLGGRSLPAAAPVMLLYLSANRDAMEFGLDAERFNIGRSPNNHLAFGSGPHLCLGATLARIELRVMLWLLLHRVARIERAAAPTGPASLLTAGPDRVPLILRSGW